MRTDSRWLGFGGGGPGQQLASDLNLRPSLLAGQGVAYRWFSGRKSPKGDLWGLLIHTGYGVFIGGVEPQGRPPPSSITPVHAGSVVRKSPTRAGPRFSQTDSDLAFGLRIKALLTLPLTALRHRRQPRTRVGHRFCHPLNHRAFII